MPKKTRRQKINAVKRRSNIKPNLGSKTPASSTGFARAYKDDADIINAPLQKPEAEKRLFSQNRDKINNFKTDLTKSMFITIILIVIQLALYYADTNKYFDLASIIRN